MAGFMTLPILYLRRCRRNRVTVCEVHARFAECFSCEPPLDTKSTMTQAYIYIKLSTSGPDLMPEPIMTVLLTTLGST